MRYHRGLMNAILGDGSEIAKAVNATVITLDEAPQGWDSTRVARKYVLNPSELTGAWANAELSSRLAAVRRLPTAGGRPGAGEKRRSRS